MKMAEYNIKELKSSGLMKQKEKDLFSLRLRIAGGFIKSEQLVKLSEIADKYGKGYVHLTTRQGVEIPNINFNDFKDVKDITSSDITKYYRFRENYWESDAGKKRRKENRH